MFAVSGHLAVIVFDHELLWITKFFRVTFEICVTAKA